MVELSEEVAYITATEVKNYAYCPRIVYFTHVLHLEERVTEYMQFGRELERERHITPIIARYKPKQVLRDVELISHRHKLAGKIEYILVTRLGEVIPVEIKWVRPEKRICQVPYNHKLQLAAYALLIEDNFNTIVKRAVAYYVNQAKLLELRIDGHLKALAIDAVNKIYNIIRSEEIPPPRRIRGKCEDCGFKQYCVG